MLLTGNKGDTFVGLMGRRALAKGKNLIQTIKIHLKASLFVKNKTAQLSFAKVKTTHRFEQSLSNVLTKCFLCM